MTALTNVAHIVEYFGLEGNFDKNKCNRIWRNLYNRKFLLFYSHLTKFLFSHICFNKKKSYSKLVGQKSNDVMNKYFSLEKKIYDRIWKVDNLLAKKSKRNDDDLHQRWLLMFAIWREKKLQKLQKII